MITRDLWSLLFLGTAGAFFIQESNVFSFMCPLVGNKLGWWWVGEGTCDRVGVTPAPLSFNSEG